jgi:LuxR family maltose regulon positive regulatory protein
MAIAIPSDVWVVPTKVRPPRLPADTIRRSRLTGHVLERLSRSLTLVCAPAGFGKSTLLVTALADSPWPVAWLSLDPEDCCLPAFLHGLVAAVQQVAPDSCRSTRSLLRLREMLQPAEVARVVGHDLVDLGENLVLVLDDYHALASPEVDALLVALLRHPIPTLHLLVASRQVPDWPLARLRAAEEVGEVGPEDLRFTGDEVRSLLAAVVANPVGDDPAATMADGLHGWAVGLRLAAVALRDEAGSRLEPTALQRRTRQYILQYLLEEIVSQQPPDVQRFLQRTAIADRVCAELGDALVDWTDPTLTGARVLAYLERSGLFVSAADGEGRWYRFHDLLRDALRQQLRLLYDDAEVASWHLRASAWFAQAGHVPEAVRHALAGNDPDTAAAVVERYGPRLLDDDKWQVLEEWLRLLPEEVARRRPAVLLCQAWAGYLRSGVAKAIPLVEQVEALLAQGGLGLPPERVAALQAEVAALWTVVSYMRGDYDRTVSYGERAWADLPATAEYALGAAGAVLGVAKQILGDPHAIQGLLASRGATDFIARPAVALQLQLALTAIYWLTGDLGRAEQQAQRTAELARTLGFDSVAAWGHYALGCIYFALDDLTSARQQFTAVIDLRHNAEVYAINSSLQGLALIDQALAGAPPAEPSPGSLLAQAPSVWALDDETMRAFEARLALARGDLVTATRWLQTAQGSPRHRQTMLLFDAPELTRIRALIALGHERALAEASGLLKEASVLYSQRHNVPRLIETQALQALTYQGQAAGEAALAALARAVELAAPRGFTRCFVELGPPMARLLVELTSRGRAHRHARHLLAAFGARPPASMHVLPSRDSVADELIEPLTERELEVLELLAGRLSNKEVARTLHISWQTVTKHTVNIYQKLQVGDRREAVHRGQALGLIPPTEPAEGRTTSPPCVVSDLT